VSLACRPETRSSRQPQPQQTTRYTGSARTGTDAEGRAQGAAGWKGVGQAGDDPTVRPFPRSRCSLMRPAAMRPEIRAGGTPGPGTCNVQPQHTTTAKQRRDGGSLQWFLLRRNSRGDGQGGFWFLAEGQGGPSRVRGGTVSCPAKYRLSTRRDLAGGLNTAD
jgi:hypothetical protein